MLTNLLPVSHVLMPYPAHEGGGGGPAGGSMWQELQDDQGRTYYYNTQTGVSQWEKPSDM